MILMLINGCDLLPIVTMVRFVYSLNQWFFFLINLKSMATYNYTDSCYTFLFHLLLWVRMRLEKIVFFDLLDVFYG
jgi:hypothetical protein